MHFQMRDAEHDEDQFWYATVELEDGPTEAVLIGPLADSSGTISGDPGFDRPMACRPATDDQSDGLRHGPGFLVLVGTVTRAIEDNWELQVGNDTILVDEEDLSGYRPQAEERISIGFQGLLITLD
jgi:hypothetical protein